MKHPDPVMKHLDPALAEPEHSVSRPHGAPAYYQGRPASLWIKVMKPRHPKAAEPNDIEQPHGLLCGLVAGCPLPCPGGGPRPRPPREAA
jgi:hypothetical protein